VKGAKTGQEFFYDFFEIFSFFGITAGFQKPGREYQNFGVAQQEEMSSASRGGSPLNPQRWNALRLRLWRLDIKCLRRDVS
jgi:hypothetical protein